MNLTLDLSLILNTLTTAGVAWLIAKVVKIDRCFGQVKTWMEAHDKQDDERHEEIMKNIDKLWARK